jgi:hypothetical protein
MRSESNAQGREARPGSGRVPSPIGLRIQERIAEVTLPSGCPPTRVRAGGRASAASLSTAEDGALEAQRLRARSRSRRRRHPDRFILQER